MAFLTNKPSYPMKACPYNSKGTTAQLSYMKWVQVQKKLYRFLLHVKFSLCFRKTTQRNEQRQWRLVGLSYSLNSYRTYIIGNTKATSMSVYIGAQDTNAYPICSINLVHTKSHMSNMWNGTRAELYANSLIPCCRCWRKWGRLSDEELGKQWNSLSG